MSNRLPPIQVREVRESDFLLQELQIDAAYVTALTMRGEGVKADAHITRVRYRERLADYQALKAAGR